LELVDLQIGIDAGGSLTKIVTIRDEKKEYRTKDFYGALELARTLTGYDRVYLTGCRAGTLEAHLPDNLKGRVYRADELEAFWAGAHKMLSEEGRPSDSFVLVAFGTGTSVFTVSSGKGTRTAGTGVGGGTLTGLSRLLIGITDFEAIMDLASRGNRHLVDLMVSDLYPDAKASPVLNELTAANFGSREVERSSKEDIASAILQLVVETIAVISIQVARAHQMETIVVAGSPTRHPLVRARFGELGALLGHDFFAFLEHGPYCGALGAIITGKRA
jgi:type II pantothenate kinase